MLFADIAHIAGFVASGLHPTPVGHAQVVATTTHKTLRGPRGGLILCDAEFAKRIDSAVFPGGQGGPLMHVIAAKAVALREALSPAFRAYCAQVLANARALADAVAASGYRVVSGGTDTHLFLLSLVDRDTTGKAAQIALERAGITTNKNMVPFDPRKPAVTSGHPHRDAGGDDPRHARAGDARDRGPAHREVSSARVTSKSWTPCAAKWKRCAGAFRSTRTAGKTPPEPCAVRIARIPPTG